VALKTGDVDSQRMVLRIEQAKARKDRYAILSPLMLERLRAWWRYAKSHRADLQNTPATPGGAVMCGGVSMCGRVVVCWPYSALQHIYECSGGWGGMT
jgi:integrase